MKVRVLLGLVLLFMQFCLSSDLDNSKKPISKPIAMKKNTLLPSNIGIVLFQPTIQESGKLWINHLLQVHPNYESYLPENKSKVLKNYYNQSDKQLRVINLIRQQNVTSEEIRILREEIAEIKRQDKMIRSLEDQRCL